MAGVFFAIYVSVTALSLPGATVMTLLGRLATKGAVEVDREREPYVYRPAHARESILKDRLRDFLHDVFDGEADAMVLGLVEDESISIDELRAIERRIETVETVVENDTLLVRMKPGLSVSTSRGLRATISNDVIEGVSASGGSIVTSATTPATAWSGEASGGSTLTLSGLSATTTTFLAWKMLNALGVRCGLIGTVVDRKSVV